MTREPPLFEYPDDDPRAARLRAYVEDDADAYTFRIERVTIQPGRTFSRDALQATIDEIGLFIGARIMARWQATGEPPTSCEISIDVSAR